MMRFNHRLLLEASAVAMALVAAPAAQADGFGAGLGLLPAPAPTPAPAPSPADGNVQTTNSGAIKPLYRNIRGFYRNIRGFWGDVNPFYRNIRGFWGDVDPFYRNIRGFWGAIDPATMATTAGAPLYSGIGPFWEDLGGQWEAVAADWQPGGDYAGNEARYAHVSANLNTLVNTSEKFWGDAVAKKTGKSFKSGFADPLFARFGVDPNDPASLAKLSANEQSHLFIDWYDGLMEFSGTDHVDWWMKSVNWTPRLTQTQGGGSDAVIGLVDFFVAADNDIKSKLIYSGGVSNFTNGHGSGVGSLIVASHDGKGIMGIAPNAKVAAYNPFDSSGSTDWDTVKVGIRAVTNAGASVVNLSLGVPGTTLSPEWGRIFRDPAIKLLNAKSVFVIAAGNDGVTQTGNLDFTGATDTPFIVVGSVGPDNQISEFSNRPGTTCLTNGPTLVGCSALNGLLGRGNVSLMSRFIVAPGELILVSDGQGGVIRESGTSLSAPIVAGAVALIQDRWPWLKKTPSDVDDIILKTAKDLGAPGVDPVYGVGLLDVEAAQSPLNYDALTFYQYDGAKVSKVEARSLKGKGIQSSWEAKGIYLTAFEQLANSQRDFLIPLSSRLVGTMKDGEYFQDFVYNAMASWLNGPSKLSDGPRGYGFSNVQRVGDVTKLGNWRMSLSGRMTDGFEVRGGYRRPHLTSAVSLTNAEGSLGFAFGSGDGAVMLGGGNGFAMTSDFDPYSGGVNPLLGFASGGSHVSASIGLSPRVAISFGTTQQERSRRRDLFDVTDPSDRLQLQGLERYRSQASNMRVDYRASDKIGFSATYTRLAEPNALYGVRSLDPQDFSGGNVTDGVTISANWQLGESLAMFGSVTGSRAHSAGNRGALRITDEGVLGSAFQVGVAKSRLLGKEDRWRITVAQPLTIERGKMEFDTVGVVERETGKIGRLTQRVDIANTGRRRLVAEGMYGTPLLNGHADVSLFGRTELRSVDANTPELMVGTRAQLTF
jgi:hypothetical protein